LRFKSSHLWSISHILPSSRMFSYGCLNNIYPPMGMDKNLLLSIPVYHPCEEVTLTSIYFDGHPYHRIPRSSQLWSTQRLDPRPMKRSSSLRCLVLPTAYSAYAAWMCLRRLWGCLVRGWINHVVFSKNHVRFVKWSFVTEEEGAAGIYVIWHVSLFDLWRLLILNSYSRPSRRRLHPLVCNRRTRQIVTYQWNMNELKYITSSY
jgi:hypothetical protein